MSEKSSTTLRNLSVNPCSYQMKHDACLGMCANLLLYSVDAESERCGETGNMVHRGQPKPLLVTYMR